jgi:hypothetical protein
MTPGQQTFISWFALLILPGAAAGIAAFLRKRG